MRSIKKNLVPLGIRILSGTRYRTRLKVKAMDGSSMDESEYVESGGFFTYLSFPADLPSANIIATTALSVFNLKFASGNISRVDGDEYKDCRPGHRIRHTARLCWAWESEEALAEGPERLAEAIKSLRGNGELRKERPLEIL